MLTLLLVVVVVRMHLTRATGGNRSSRLNINSSTLLLVPRQGELSINFNNHNRGKPNSNHKLMRKSNHNQQGMLRLRFQQLRL